MKAGAGVKHDHTAIRIGCPGIVLGHMHTLSPAVDMALPLGAFVEHRSRKHPPCLYPGVWVFARPAHAARAAILRGVKCASGRHQKRSVRREADHPLLPPKTLYSRRKMGFRAAQDEENG
jgi:hypothetical protein